MAVSGYVLEWTFQGLAQGNTIAGTVDLGEYGKATWKAVRA
jgi:D-glucosaminate-6-phosphate ammonia-lyase